MDGGITWGGLGALAGAMAVLALLPSLSVLTVSARAAAHGFPHGALTALGVVTGDIVFIVIAVGSLSFVADAMNTVFVVIKYAGSAYLIWLGVKILRSQPATVEATPANDASLLSSFLAGLLLTLGDQKAILFYLGFFPAFVDLSAVTIAEVGIIVAVATVVVGGVKLGYAFAADRAKRLFSRSKANRALQTGASLIMFTAGIVLAFKA